MVKLAKVPTSFESALADIERLVQSMANGDMPLDATLKAYKEGIDLLKFCQETLSDAETQIKILENGQLKTLDLQNGV